MHYQRWQKYGDAIITKKTWGTQSGECIVADCISPKRSKNYCQLHYHRFYRHGDPLAILRESKSPTGRRINNQGYVVLRGYKSHVNSHPNGTILEHVLVMSNYLQRPLLPHENVHHKNGDRADNNLENLELWSKSQPAGQRVDDKIVWAIELLKLYKPEIIMPTKE